MAPPNDNKTAIPKVGEQPATVNVDMSKLLARMDAIESKSTSVEAENAALRAEIAALKAGKIAAPQAVTVTLPEADSIHRARQERLEKKLALQAAAQEAARDQLEAGPNKFRVGIYEKPGGTGRVINREAIVGGTNEYEAQAKYLKFYGVISTRHVTHATAVDAKDVDAVRKTLRPLKRSAEPVGV